MSPRQQFRIGTALVGLWQIIQGLLFLADAAMVAAHVYNPPEFSGYTMHTYAVMGIFRMLIGFFVMGGFPAFDRLVFPRHHRETADDGAATIAENTTDVGKR